MEFGQDRSWCSARVRTKFRKVLRFRMELKDSIKVKTQVVIKEGTKRSTHIHSTLRR